MKEKLAADIENFQRVSELVHGPKSILGDFWTPLSQLQKQTVLYVVLYNTVILLSIPVGIILRNTVYFSESSNIWGFGVISMNGYVQILDIILDIIHR